MILEYKDKYNKFNLQTLFYLFFFELGFGVEPCLRVGRVVYLNVVLDVFTFTDLAIVYFYWININF
jgi:hypothetical protein